MATATEKSLLEAQPRTSGNKNAARRVRRDGKVPGVLYGAGKETLSVSLDPRHVSRILNSQTGYNTIFELALTGGERTQAMIVDWQYEPIKDKLIHVDLKRIAMDQVMKVEVPIQLVGVAIGVKEQGGILDQVLRELEIECLPGDIPAHIVVDVSNLKMHEGVRVGELEVNPKLKYLTDADATIAHVTSVREEVVATPDAVAVAAPAEPEVVKKGKQDAEEGDAAAGAKGAKK